MERETARGGPCQVATQERVGRGQGRAGVTDYLKYRKLKSCENSPLPGK